MGNVKRNSSGVFATMIAVAVLLSVAVWQFYLFVTFKTNGIADTQGGQGHMWVAIIAAVFACLAGFFVFSVFLRYDREDEMHITSAPRPAP